MVGSQWKAYEERALWAHIANGSPFAIDPADRKVSFAQIATKLQGEMGNKAKRTYSGNMLYEHYYSVIRRPSKVAEPFVRHYLNRIADFEEAHPDAEKLRLSRRTRPKIQAKRNAASTVAKNGETHAQSTASTFGNDNVQSALPTPYSHKDAGIAVPAPQNTLHDMTSQTTLPLHHDAKTHGQLANSAYDRFNHLDAIPRLSMTPYRFEMPAYLHEQIAQGPQPIYGYPPRSRGGTVDRRFSNNDLAKMMEPTEDSTAVAPMRMATMGQMTIAPTAAAATEASGRVTAWLKSSGLSPETQIPTTTYPMVPSATHVQPSQLETPAPDAIESEINLAESTNVNESISGLMRLAEASAAKATPADQDQQSSCRALEEFKNGLRPRTRPWDM